MSEAYFCPGADAQMIHHPLSWNRAYLALVSGRLCIAVHQSTSQYGDPPWPTTFRCMSL